MVAGVVTAQLRIQLQIAILIDVDEANAVAFLPRLRQPEASSAVGERAVAIIVKKAVRLDTTKLRIAGAEIEVDITVIVQVCDSCPHDPHRVVKPRLPSYVAERSIPVV